MLKRTCNRHRGHRPPHGLATALFSIALPFLNSCSSPSTRPALPKPGLVATPSLQTQPALQAQIPSPATAAVLAVEPADVVTPAGARHLDAMLQSGHSSSVLALAFSRDGKWLASGGLDGSILLWNASTGEQIQKWGNQNAQVTQLVFSPDSQRLISADSGGMVRGWNLESRKPEYVLKYPGFTRVLACSPDSELLAIAASPKDEESNTQIKVHQIRSGNLIRTLETAWQGVTAMTFTRQGSLIASGGALDSDDAPDLSTATWNVNTWRVETKISGGGVAFSPDGSLLADFEELNPARILIKNALTGEKRLVISAKAVGPISFSPDGQKIVLSGVGNEELQIWSIQTGKEIVTIPGEAAAGSGGLQTVVFSADAKTLAAAPYQGNVIKMWDSSTGRELHAFPGQLGVQGITISPNGRWLVAGSAHGTNIWDMETRKLTRTLDGAANFAIFSKDGRWLATNPGIQFSGETLKVFDAKTWAPVADFHFPQRGTPVFSIAFIPNDSPLTTLGPISRSFEFSAEGQKHTLWSSPSPVSVSPDQKILAVHSGMGGDVDLWDLMSGQKLRTLAAHKLSVFALFFSGDGHWLLTAGQETPVTFPRAGGPLPPVETRIRIWDTTTWTEHTSMAFNRIGAGAAAFSLDSRTLIVEKSWDLVELFDVVTGRALGTFTANDPLSHARQFSTGNLLITPDGSLLMQAAQNGIRIWRIPAPQSAASNQ